MKRLHSTICALWYILQSMKWLILLQGQLCASQDFRGQICLERNLARFATSVYFAISFLKYKLGKEVMDVSSIVVHEGDSLWLQPPD